MCLWNLYVKKYNEWHKQERKNKKSQSDREIERTEKRERKEAIVIFFDSKKKLIDWLGGLIVAQNDENYLEVVIVVE